MHVRERELIILRALAERRFVSSNELTEICEASEATLRRDLSRLAAQGRLLRVRGGAQALDHPDDRGPSLAGQPLFRLEAIANARAKRAIARRAAELCAPDDSLVIDGGTTTWFLASALRKHELRILTNSFPVAEFLLHHSHNRIVLPGGEIYRDQQVIVTPFEDAVLSSFAATKMFMSPQGLSRIGVMQTDPLLLQTERLLLDRAEQLIVLADSDKFGRRGPLVLCALERIDVLITDERVSIDHVRMLEDAGVRVEIAAASVAAATVSE